MYVYIHTQSVFTPELDWGEQSKPTALPSTKEHRYLLAHEAGWAAQPV
jgi:hypothetical protein